MSRVAAAIEALNESFDSLVEISLQHGLNTGMFDASIPLVS